MANIVVKFKKLLDIDAIARLDEAGNPVRRKIKHLNEILMKKESKAFRTLDKGYVDVLATILKSSVSDEPESVREGFR